MIEKIYTIPVSEAFEADCECPICLLEKRFEDEKVSYYLGASLMEPDNRKETNKYGFCRHHLEMLYNNKSNTLGLALIIETHLKNLTDKLKSATAGGAGSIKAPAGILKTFLNPKGTKPGIATSVSSYIAWLNKECCVCKTLEYTMNRYYEVIYFLWKTEPDFRNLYNSKKGFCLPHLRMLLENSKKHLKGRTLNDFMQDTMKMQMDNLKRIYDEVNWFTQKFDYRYKDEPWGNSKDAVPRAIQKIAGYMKLND